MVSASAYSSSLPVERPRPRWEMVTSWLLVISPIIDSMKRVVFSPSGLMGEAHDYFA